MSDRTARVEDVYPLAPLQSGILFLALLNEGRPVYVEQLVYELTGPLDVDRFEEAWRLVVRRHPSLRTAFVWEGFDEALQVVNAEVAVSLRRLDWSDLVSDEQERKLRDLRAEERITPLKLNRAPLFRLVLVRTGADAYRCVWTYHHLIVDGWSQGLIWRDVFTVYRYLLGEIPSLPPQPPSYRRDIEWLLEQDRAAAEVRWRKALAGFTSPTLLSQPVETANPRALRPSGEIHIDYTTLSADFSDALARLARQHHVTLNAFLQGVLALTLWRAVGEEDVLFGGTTSGPR